MKEHKSEFEIKVMTRVLDVCSSGYYAWVDCYDNAMMESFKVEWIPDCAYALRELGKLDVFTYIDIEAHYNLRCPMARLGDLSSIQFELKGLADFRKQ